jgi:hypothetical protein
MRKTSIAALAIVLFMAGAASAQKQLKPWGEWTQKDAQKILDDSAWGRTQTETDTSQMFYSPTSDPGRTGPDRNLSSSTASAVDRRNSNDSSRLSQGATNQAVPLNFRIRFFTAKPIRQAFARMIALKQANLTKELTAQLTAWSDAHTDDWIIVAVAFDSTDQRYSGPVMQAFGSATTDTVKNSTYLERKDGKRVFASEYQAPGSDGAGAKFVFPRTVNGQPFVNAESGEIRFYSEFQTAKPPIKIDMRFKVADMLFDGKLEY